MKGLYRRNLFSLRGSKGSGVLLADFELLERGSEGRGARQGQQDILDVPGALYIQTPGLMDIPLWMGDIQE